MNWKISYQYILSIILLLCYGIVANNNHIHAMCVGTATVAQGTSVSATTTGNNTSADYETLFILTDNFTNVIATNTTGIFSTTSLNIGPEYHIYILNYDTTNPPSGLPLTTSDDLTAINDGCYDANYTHEILCLHIQAPLNCIEDREIAQGADISVNTTGNTTTTDYDTRYVLADQSGIIISSNTSGVFSTGGLTVGLTYQIHVLNYDVTNAPMPLPSSPNDDINTIGVTETGCYDAEFTTEYLCITIISNDCVDPSSVTASATSACMNGTGTVTINASTTSGNALEYSIGGPFYTNNTFTNVSNNTYTVTVRDAGTLCTAMTSVQVNCTEPCPTMNAVDDNNIVCVNGTTELAAWQTAVSSANNSVTGVTGPSYSSVPTTATDFPQVVGNATYDGDNCSTETENYYAYYTCTSDDSFLPAGTYILTLYPAINQQNNVVQNAGSCCPSVQLQCTTGYSVTSDLPNCNSQINAGSINFTVSLDNPPTGLDAACTSFVISSNYDCRACPTANNASGNFNFCVDDANVDLSLNGESGVGVASDPGGTFVGLVWYAQGSIPGTDPVYVAGSTTVNDHCNAISTVVEAYLLCDLNGDGFNNDSDDSYIGAGSITVTAYPAISQQNNIVMEEGGCCPMLQLECATGYSMTNDAANCNSQTNAGAINFTVSLDNPPTGLDAACTRFLIPSTYDCRTCPIANPASGSFLFCANDAAVDLTLNGASGVSIVSDPSSMFAGLAWYAQGNTPGIDPVYMAGNTATLDNCNTISAVVEAYLLCDLDGDGFNDGPDDSYVPAGSITVVVFPDVGQQNNIVIDEGGCCPSLQLECATGYSYTNTLDSTTGDPDCTNQEGEGSFNFIIQIDDVPIGLNAPACLSNTIRATYRCCVAKSGVITYESACPQSDFVVFVSNQTAATDHGTWLIITEDNGDIVDVIDFGGTATLTIPYSAWAGYLGYGMNYTFYSYNYQLEDPPTPDPNGATNIVAIGSIDDGCFDLSDVGEVEYIPKQYNSAGLNTSEGNQGGVTPFFYNTHDITFTGGTPPYSYKWEYTGYVRRTINFYEDGYDHEIDDLDVLADPGIPNSNPGGVIDIIYADQATWSVIITDANGCSHPSWQMTNNPANAGNSGEILDIYNHTITGTSNETIEDGAIDITVEGGCPPYTYQWGGPFGVSMTTEDISDLHYGWYFVSITDAGESATCLDEKQQTTTGWYWVPKRMGDVGSGFIRGKEIENITTNLVVYPNPLETTTTVVFMTRRATTQTTVSLYSINGKKVKEVFQGKTLAQQLNHITLDVDDLANGVYVLQLSTSTGEQQQQKIMIVH